MTEKKILETFGPPDRTGTKTYGANSEGGAWTGKYFEYNMGPHPQGKYDLIDNTNSLVLLWASVQSLESLAESNMAELEDVIAEFRALDVEERRAMLEDLGDDDFETLTKAKAATRLAIKAIAEVLKLDNIDKSAMRLASRRYTEECMKYLAANGTVEEKAEANAVLQGASGIWMKMVI